MILEVVIGAILVGVVVYLAGKNLDLKKEKRRLSYTLRSSQNLNSKLTLENNTYSKNQTGFKEEINSLKEQLEASIKKNKNQSQELLNRGEEIKDLKEKLAEVTPVFQERVEKIKKENVEENADQEVTQPVKPKRVYKKRVKNKD